MAKGPNQKLKLMYLADILKRKTDDEHDLMLTEIAALLEAQGIQAERKTFYTDFEELRKYGIDVQGRKRGNYYYYHVGEREFDLAELKLIIDSIQSAKFMTERKSRELIKKIEKLASEYQEKELHRQVLIAGRVKTRNESIYYNVDAIHHAINEKKQIQFQYVQWTLKKTLEKRHDGKVYQVTPWALMWDDENYYLVAYDAEADIIKHFRVDKMIRITEIDAKPEGKKVFQSLNTSDYARQHFGMFTGDLKEVELLVKNELVGVMIDRFGKKIPIIPVDEEHFKTSATVALSPQFVGWVLSLGDGVKVIGPVDVVATIKTRAEELYKMYQEER